MCSQTPPGLNGPAPPVSRPDGALTLVCSGLCCSGVRHVRGPHALPSFWRGRWVSFELTFDQKSLQKNSGTLQASGV